MQIQILIRAPIMLIQKHTTTKQWIKTVLSTRLFSWLANAQLPVGGVLLCTCHLMRFHLHIINNDNWSQSLNLYFASTLASPSACLAVYETKTIIYENIFCPVLYCAAVFFAGTAWCRISPVEFAFCSPELRNKKTGGGLNFVLGQTILLSKQRWKQYLPMTWQIKKIMKFMPALAAA